MMANLIRHAERLATDRAERLARAAAAELEALVRDASVEIDGTQVVVRGRRLAQQWLSEPGLRFFGGSK